MISPRRALEMAGRTREAFAARGVRGGLAWVLGKVSSKLLGVEDDDAPVPRRLPVAAPAHPAAPQVCFFAYRLRRGFGVDVVAAEQIEHFLARGYAVSAFVLETDGGYEERFASWIEAGRLEVIPVRTVEEAVAQAEERRPILAVAHTPPFYRALSRMGRQRLRVFFDHGEPPPDLFADRPERERIEEERRRDAAGADLVVTISEFLRRTSVSPTARVIRNGNDHLLKRRSNLSSLAGTFRARTGLADQRIVLNVTRFSEAERRYKGCDHFAEVRAALQRIDPEAATRTAFVLLGKGEDSDRRWAEAQGLHALTNVDEDLLVAAYLDADAYLSTSQWEGYNLGIAQALAFGVPCFASDRGAHPEFEIPVSNVPEELAAWVAAVARGSEWTQRFAQRRVWSFRESARALEQSCVEQGLAPTSPLSFAQRAQWAPFRASLAARPTAAPEISFLILNKDRPALLRGCVASIERECRVPFEILIGDTGSTDPEVLDFYGVTRHRVIYLGHYQFSRGNNALSREARGDVLCLINNDVELICCDFAQAVQLAREEAVGTVGAYLCYPDYRLQHAGVRICPSPPYRGVPEHFDRFAPLDGYPGLVGNRDAVAVTGAFLLMRRQLYRTLGGLDEHYVEEGQDAALCLELWERGLRNVMSPALVAYHLENATRTTKESASDRQRLAARFGGLIEQRIYAWQAEHRLG